MLGMPVEPPRAPWTFTEVAGHQLDAVGATDGSLETRRLASADGDGFALAYVDGPRLVGVAVVDGGVPVETARGLVERGASGDELAAAVG
jgi:hypothetical protein